MEDTRESQTGDRDHESKMMSTDLKNGRQEDIFEESGHIAVAKPESGASPVETYECNSDVALEAFGVPSKETAKLRQGSFSASGRRSSRPVMSSAATTATTRSVAPTPRSINANRRSSDDLDGGLTELDDEGIAAEQQAEKYSTPEDYESHNQASQRGNKTAERNVEQNEDTRESSQNTSGRTWDVLWSHRSRAKATGTETDASSGEGIRKNVRLDFPRWPSAFGRRIQRDSTTTFESTRELSRMSTNPLELRPFNRMNSE